MDGKQYLRTKKGPVYGYYSSTGKKILEASGYKEDEWYSIRDFKNEYVKNNSQIPTFANVIGYLGIIDNKYVVLIHGDSGRRPDNYIKTVETDLAQELIKANRANNQKTKNSIDTKIANTKITTDTEEYKNKTGTANIEKNNKDNNLIENNKIYIIIAFAILIIFIIIIILIKRRKNNGRK